MANVSDWKGFEKQVAVALGGKRRLRTMESFGKEAPDVYFPKKLRRKFPCLKTVAIECKKRKAINIYKFFTASKLKYSKDGKRLVLATKVPATAAGRKSWKQLKGKLGKRYGLSRKERKHLKLQDFIAPLVTVELDFFVELWDCWKEKNGRRKET